ncbi:MAG: winged helix-turn-helix transcriptional regulator [Micromonosporaceae bacterium]|jgi:DNA-binding MarR family transcriptional regulator|nr:winged helix-turn-helix transcriptional regulator [Micromonosporaceae bacterium]
MASGAVRPADAALTDRVVDGLLAAGRMLVAQTARSLAQLDVNVTLPQFRALVVLAASGPRRVVDLAAELGVQPSTATRMCDRLVRKQLVSRHVRPDDRRAAWVVLTTTGRDLIAEIMRRRRDELAGLVATVDIPDPQAFAAGLDALVVAGGELPEAQWWQRWAATGAPAETPQP